MHKKSFESKHHFYHFIILQFALSKNTRNVQPQKKCFCSFLFFLFSCTHITLHLFSFSFLFLCLVLLFQTSFSKTEMLNPRQSVNSCDKVSCKFGATCRKRSDLTNANVTALQIKGHSDLVCVCLFDCPRLPHLTHGFLLVLRINWVTSCFRSFKENLSQENTV